MALAGENWSRSSFSNPQLPGLVAAGVAGVAGLRESAVRKMNMVNGLRWGPDGWLYGRHGVTDTSIVGTPRTPLGKRIRLNCSIWRFHPLRKIFEVVTHGTTNPWGLDYDDHGQWFFTNNVINHLWHVVPGIYKQRSRCPSAILSSII